MGVTKKVIDLLLGFIGYLEISPFMLDLDMVEGTESSYI